MFSYNGLMKRLADIHPVIIGSVIFLCICLYPLPVVPMRNQTIEKIALDAQSETLKINLTGRTPVKVFQADPKEIIIALKGAKLSKNAFEKEYKSSLVQKIHRNVLPDNIVVLEVSTRHSIEAIVPVWTDGNRTLLFNLAPNRPVAAPKGTQSQKSANPEKSKPSPAPPPAGIRFPELSIATLEDLDKKPIDSIDELLTTLQTDECRTHPTIRRAATKCASQDFSKAFEDLGPYVESDSQKECLETAYYLRAYAFYKKRNPDIEDQNLKAISLFQEAVSYYPKSRYIPYGITALGKINRRLKNYDEARGYFKVILDSYNNYPGMPEVILELARLYIDQEKTGLAIATLERLISGYPNNPYASDAKLDLGKALYEANRFQEALNHFGSLIKSSPRLVYESPDLMVYLGNTYYQMGDLTHAGDVLVRAINYFPDIPDVHIVLTRIGDIFRDQKQSEKAEKIYEHVVKNYPGTDGYIVSSVRMAEFFDRRAKKENLYRMIINDYPDHPLTQLAYVKLANLMNSEGEYEKSIEVIHTFLAKYPGALKKEAVYVMKDAYGSLFRKLMKADDTAGLLTWYERDKSIINRINSPDIYNIVGTAYCLGHIYEEAAKLLEKAHQLSGKDERTPELVFNLGVSFMESGQADRALKTLDDYTRKYPKHDHMAEAFNRMGQILLEKKKFKDARDKFKLASRNTQNKEDKASAIIREAEANKALGEFPAAARNLIHAIDLLSGIPDQSNATFSKLYRDLGDMFLETQSYLKAADAFSMALKFSDRRENPDLRFLLAETYEKGRKIEMAGKIYQEIIDLGDPFWVRLAQEKLRGIQIETKLKPNRALNG